MHEIRPGFPRLRKRGGQFRDLFALHVAHQLPRQQWHEDDGRDRGLRRRLRGDPPAEANDATCVTPKNWFAMRLIARRVPRKTTAF